MWPFKRQPLLDDDTARWHVDNMCWLLRNLARTSIVRESRLILPGPHSYRLGKATGEELALLIFEQTKAFAGMVNWPLALFPSIYEEEDCFGFASGMEDNPYELIAMLVRKLAHRLLMSLEGTPPCDETELNALSEVLGCLMGFGVFLTNDATSVITLRQGGRMSVGEYKADVRGALSERELVFDLAMFLTIRDLQPDNAFRYLEPLPSDNLKTAMKDMNSYRTELKAAAEGF
jgi:hypothetical protein